MQPVPAVGTYTKLATTCHVVKSNNQIKKLNINVQFIHSYIHCTYCLHYSTYNLTKFQILTSVEMGFFSGKSVP